MSNAKKKNSEITNLLQEWKSGRDDAFDRLFPKVYDELKLRASRYLRSERKGHTLQTTALVHEAYLKLFDKKQIDYSDRNHFFAIAANVMRRILVDHAKARNRAKRGGKDENLPLEEARIALNDEGLVDLEALDEALKELVVFDERQARIVELKYFGGMTNEETAKVIGVSNATVRRDWDLAKAWLRTRLS